VVLLPGMHTGPCKLSQGGMPGEPKVLRSQDPDLLTAIVYDGNSSNVIDVASSDIVIQGLSFGPSNQAIDAIKIKSGDRITIRDNNFFQVGGISISANASDSKGIEIIGNYFKDLKATGIYLGCHAGMGECAAIDFVIADNLIDGVDSAAVGYGLEIKLDSYGVIRDNVIDDTKGPGIEIYGSVDLSRKNLVEGNIVGGSRNNSSLEIGGGPVLVRNNIVLGGAASALQVYDYNKSGHVHDIQLLGNTVIGDQGPAVQVGGSWMAEKSLEMTGNAVWQESGEGPALPAPVVGVVMAGNVDCTDPAECWVDAAGRDLWPTPGGRLLVEGALPELAELSDDFCHNERGAPPHVGAFERLEEENGPGPLTIGFKKTSIACPVAGSGTTGGETTGGETTGGETTGGETTGGETTGGSTGSSGGASTTAGTGTGSGSGDSMGSGATVGSATSTSGDDGGLSEGGGCACSSAARGDREGLMLVLSWGLLGVALRRRRPV